MENNSNHHQLPPPSNSQPPSPSYSQPPSPSYSQLPLMSYSQHVDSRTHALPVTRVKRIMKFDPDVEMISREAPNLLAKACEMFIEDLTTRSWHHAEEHKSYTLQRSDISEAVARTIQFDFLLDIVPKEEPVAANIPVVLGLPYCHNPMVRTPFEYDGRMYPQTPEQTQAWPGALTAASGEEDSGEANIGDGSEYLNDDEV